MLPGDLIVLASKAHYPYINICAASQQQSAVFSREYFKSELLECQIGSVWLHFNYSSHWIMLVGEGRCATSVAKEDMFAELLPIKHCSVFQHHHKSENGDQQ